MGSCFSTKKQSSSSSSSVAAPTVSTVQPLDPNKSPKSVQVIPQQETTTKKEKEGEGLVKKEIFVIKHRTSHEKRSLSQQNEVEGVDNEEMGNNINTIVRASSCTKEEVDAILIQCGRLSRSNSSGKAASSSARKYSGSKRSYDFDHIETSDGAVEKKSSEDEDQTRQHRQRHRHRSSSQGRRRTPSRERDQQQQRSGSRERGGSISGGGRRVSRSPGRRTENNTSNTSTTRPGKMVSVPASVNVVEKTNNNINGVGVVEPIKRISVKRNVASPRSQSPARTANPNVKISNDSQHHPSLSRTSSRKAEHSPYRRNPLTEIDTNNNRLQTRSKDIQAETLLLKDSSTNILSQAPMQKPNVEIAAQGTNYKTSSRDKEEAKAQVPITNNVTLPQTLTRSRSSRRSRDLDLNPELLLNPTPSYTALLLEDIQNFHQNNSTPFSLPPCVSKACSILEAVADLNSTTSSNLSCTFSEDTYNISLVGKKMRDGKDPFVESEVLASDDLTEPSFHKYVTVRRGGSLGGADLDEQESSGSNSYVGGVQQNRNLSSSSWEPNSADSTDRWTSIEEGQRHISETKKGLSGRKRDTDYQKGGIRQSRAGAGASKSIHTVSVVSAAGST